MKGGCDKGFCISYWKLSYRRKLVRTAWWFAFVFVAAIILLLAYPEGRATLSYGAIAVLAVIFVIQAAYNYIRWKSEIANE
jgi:ABC-type branched-subunit amino acid transport system permease subunit